jgi:hypothetical protein
MPNLSAIRALFLHPRPTYPLPDAANLLGVAEEELRGWIDVGELEAVGTREAVALPWEEVVSFGMDRWPQEAVEEALGEELARAIPELLRLTDLEVRIPRMQVAALERLAAIDDESVSAVLSRELRDLVSVHFEWLALEVAGFAEAFAWPASVR